MNLVTINEIDSQDEIIERFIKYMPNTNDLTLLVLKGHLLVEEQINMYLDFYLQNPKALKNTNLPFSTKLSIVQALLQKTIILKVLSQQKN